MLQSDASGFIIVYILLHSCNGKNNCKRAGTVVEGKALEQYGGVICLKAFENTSESCSAPEIRLGNWELSLGHWVRVLGWGR